MRSAAAAWSHCIAVVGPHDPRPSRAKCDRVRQLGTTLDDPRNDGQEDRHGG